MKKSLFLFFLFLSLHFYQCKKVNPLDAITGAFEKAEKDIANQSISWQQTLKDLENQVKDDVSQIIREDLTYFVKTSIANTGMELRYNAIPYLTFNSLCGRHYTNNNSENVY